MFDGRPRHRRIQCSEFRQGERLRDSKLASGDDVAGGRPRRPLTQPEFELQVSLSIGFPQFAIVQALESQGSLGVRLDACECG